MAKSKKGMISVVIPAYNEEKNLPKTAESIKKYFDSKKLKYEIIIVDDGSRDNTVKVAKSLMRKNPKIRLISNSRNQGMPCMKKSNQSMGRTSRPLKSICSFSMK